MTSATPKPRAGEHVLTYSAKWADQEVDKIIDERDLLREREMQLTEALRAVLRSVPFHHSHLELKTRIETLLRNGR